jgi:hypothetical protein
MDVLGLSVEELRAASAACAHIRIPNPALGYLRQFLMERLAGDRPELAAKVAALDDWQFRELFLVLRSRQSHRGGQVRRA